MGRLVLRALRDHPLRAVLSCATIVVGVAFFVATASLIETTRAASSAATSQSYPGAAVVIEGLPVSSGLPGLAGRAPLPSSLRATVAALPALGRVSGQSLGNVELLTPDRVLLGQSSSAPTGTSFGSSPGLEPASLIMGHPPRSGDEMVVDSSTFDHQHWALGQRVPVASSQRERTFRVVGVMQGGLASSAATSSLAGFSPATAQRLFNLADRFTLLVATARPGFSDAVAARETQKALGRRYQVLTHQQFSAQQHALPATSGSGVNGVLGDLVVVALFVALMVIANAFTIVVAQRRRELALLRCLGASRSQVGNLVVVEAVLVGLLGSLAGLGVGVGAAALLRELPLASLAPLRSVPLQVGLPTLILGVVLGVTVAAVGSLVPAIKAAHIPRSSLFTNRATRDRTLPVGRPSPVCWAASAFSGWPPASCFDHPWCSPWEPSSS